jgi:hypothetical protein
MQRRSRWLKKLTLEESFGFREIRTVFPGFNVRIFVDFIVVVDVVDDVCLDVIIDATLFGDATVNKVCNTSNPANEGFVIHHILHVCISVQGRARFFMAGTAALTSHDFMLITQTISGEGS